MPITIYWGPPGAYKTSSALIDFFADAAFSGRDVFTNIRGLDDRGRVVVVLEKAFPKGLKGNAKIPESWKLIHVPSEDLEGRQRWQTFFHDAPLGALIIIDEAQQIWRREMRPNDLAHLDYPGGPAAAERDNRPADIRAAFELHRHFNWDFVLTCQNVSQLHDMIRQTAEMAHKHQNLASVLPFMKGHYVVRTHPADSGAYEKHIINQRNRVIQKWVFDLYRSTATDEVKDTNVGISIWRNPAISVPVIGLVACAVYLFFFGRVGFLKAGENTEKVDTTHVVSVKGASGDGVGGGSLSIGSGGQGANDAGSGLRLLETDFVDSKFWIVGDNNQRGILFEISGDKETTGIILDQGAIERLGYSVFKFTSCLVKVTKGKEEQYVRCRGEFGKNNGNGII